MIRGFVSTIVATLVASVLAGSAVHAAESEDACKKDTSAGKLRHVVVFKFKEGTAPEKEQEIANAFAALPKQIDSIIEFEWGLNNSPEGHDQGFTHVFLVTFADEAGRDKYLPHPAHQAFVKLLRPHLEKVFVVDYFAK
ncbi:MAG: Dabb family protein [Patescibacteria group bacterium]|nr:Dabb family protein [Patescibacteria group bacterium]